LSFSLSFELDIDVDAFSNDEMEGVLELVGLVWVADYFDIHGLFWLQ
jgi:hypothetical protein